MRSTSKGRALVTIAATVFGAVCGTLAGHFIGRLIVLRLTADKLGPEATHVSRLDDEFAQDTKTALTQMNASTLPFCSEADLESIRNILFHSHFLKEAGRIRDGRIICSATFGRVQVRAGELPQPDFVAPNGLKLYRNLPAFRLENWLVLTSQAGESYVVVNPYINSQRDPFPMHYTVTMMDGPPNQTNQLMGDFPQLTGRLLTTDGNGRQGDVLYSTHCSIGDRTCITTILTVSETLNAERGQLTGYVAFGGVSGALLGFFASLVHRRRRSTGQQLRRAIGKDRLRVVYQPVVEIESRRIVGAEALARWTDEEGIAVGLEIFVRLAEEWGFVGEITELVVRHALRDLGDILQKHPDFRLAVNVAAADLSDRGFLSMLEKALKRSGVATRSLALEITESSTARNNTAIETIRVLRQRGHRVYIDDFGTGYSSLSYLHALSIDAIKIDKSFIQTIGTEAVTGCILPQILSIAKELSLEVILEGIETQEQLDHFSNAGQNLFAQGWLFGFPVPAAEFQRRLTSD